MDESLVVRLRTPPAGGGPPFRFGSGYLIGGGRILTAGHTLRPPGDDTHVPVTGDLCQVLPWGGDPQVGWLPGRVERCEAELDLAIVSVPRLGGGADPVRWGRLDGSDPVRWKAIGFPVAGLDDSGRQPETVWGEVSPTTESFAHLLGLKVDSRVARPTPAGTSGWAGLSGAAVFSRDRLVGVVIEDPQEFAGSLTARRIDCLAGRPLLYEAAGSPVIEAVSAESAMKREFLTRPRDGYFVDVPPLLSGGLVGRDDLMTRAVDLLIRGEDVAFVGLGGAGKSALASALVRDDSVRARFRAGIFWLSVGRTKDGPPDLRLKLSNWARELHKPNDRIVEASRMGMESLVDLVNEGFGAARMLLIFDDVWENSEALLFKRLGPECRRILTTRVNSVANLVSTHGVLPVDDLPDSEEARELFDRLAPAVVQQRPDTASVVIPVIGRLPLVLVIAASYLQARVIDDPTCLDEALADVLDVNQRLKLAPDMPDLITTDSLRETAATLEAVIDLSAGSLSTDDRRALTSLAAFPPKMNSFSWDAARAVAESREAVVTLRRYSLVEDLVEDLPAFRLTMHQTIHDYAAHETEGDPDACRRMAEYFLAFISKQQENATHAEAWLAALEQEKDNIRAALEWAIAREETLLAYQLMSELWDYWYRRSHYAIATELADRILALHLADTRSSQLLRAKLLNDTGNFAYNMADLKQAEQRHSAALAIRQKFDDDSIAGSWNNLGLVYRERGDYEMADRFFNQALDRNRTAKNKYWEAMNLDNVGINARFRHDLEASEEILREAAAIFANLKDPWGLAMAQIDLALTLVDRDRLTEARQLLISNLTDRWKAKDQKLSAAALRGLAAISSAEGRSEWSLNLLNASLGLSVPILDRLGEHQSLIALISIYGNRGDHRAVARIVGVLGALHASTGLASPLDEGVTARIISDARGSLGKEFEELASEGRAAAIAKDGVLDVENSVKPLLKSVNAEGIVTEVLAEK